MMMSRPKSVIAPRHKGRRIDLFSVIFVFVIIALPLSVLYQVSVHYFGDNPAVAVVDMLRTGTP
ncbi:hypothetical protein [Rhabdochromatium marinum]|uniref:hypothetical protein n=1 Tax=Rhabdochromatium marinum TaxID=48729 RepID=UPI001903C92A|nr:hypothetical protein [Rhabdochromatium marinum]